LAVLLQSADCDCTELLAQFTGQRPSLLALRKAFQEVQGDRYAIDQERVPAVAATNDFASAYTVAEFMLNLMPRAIASKRRGHYSARSLTSSREPRKIRRTSHYATEVTDAFSATQGTFYTAF
jgi:hypothetical protein